MIDIRRILCPVDFSEHSRRALDHAVAIARWYESPVTVLHVYSSVAMPALGPGPAAFDATVMSTLTRGQLDADLRAFADAERAPGVTLETVVREGETAGEILAQAASMPADLLVVGTHGRSGFERFLLGSVAEKLLHRAACPVLTVPRAVPHAVPFGPVVYKRILCPVDFSGSSLAALTYALSLSQEADGRLTVLHVVTHEFEYPAGVEDPAGMTVGRFLKAREEAGQRQLQEAIAGAGAADFGHVEPLLTSGKPWREVLRVAADQESDLIVIGVRGRGATSLMLTGSTTQHVVRHAACPVLTLRG